jgi:tryptophanyl-tRNA synthetase
LTDSLEYAIKKIQRAVTDSGSGVKYSADKPAIKNLINIYSAFSGKKPEEIEDIYKGKGYAEFKEGLAKIVVGFLKPFQERYNSFSDEEVLKILNEGAEKVRPIAKKKLKEVKEKIGFLI